MDVVLREARETDYEAIADAVQRWWNQPGFDSEAARRERAALVPRLWLQHFARTSLVAEREGELAGFLIGFASGDRADESYIHFVGVNPNARSSGLGRRLYERFFEGSRARGHARVRCVTSPTNTTSIAFHRAMGFALEQGDAEREGISVKSSYDGPGVDRVAFVREI